MFVHAHLLAGSFGFLLGCCGHVRANVSPTSATSDLISMIIYNTNEKHMLVTTRE